MCYSSDMAGRASVNVSITPELEQFVQGLVASGRYRSASEVFRDGLRLLEEAERQRLLEKWLAEGLTAAEKAKLPPALLQEARSQLEAKVREGLDALNAGDAIDGEKFFGHWKARLDKVATTDVSPRAKRRR